MFFIKNSPESYMLHPYNGIPIKSWYHEKEDEELKKFSPVLVNLTNFHDVRAEIGKIVFDDLIDWQKIEKWLIKSQKKFQNSLRIKEKFENIENNCTIKEEEKSQEKNNNQINENVIKKAEDEKSREFQTTPITNKKNAKIKQIKTIQNIFNLKSKKITTKFSNKKVNKNTTNTLSNLETTINNNTLNNTIQFSNVNDHQKSIINTSTGKKNYSTPKSNVLKINYKMNSALSNSRHTILANQHTNISNTKTAKQDTSVNNNITQEENLIQQISQLTQIKNNHQETVKTRNLIYSLHNDKTYRTNAAFQNNTQESLKLNNTNDDEKLAQNLTKSLINNKNKSTQSIFKPKSKNPLTFSSIANQISANVKNNSKPNFLKLDSRKLKENSPLLKHSIGTSKASQNKLLINSVQLRKKNSTPRQNKILSLKEGELSNIFNKVEYLMQIEKKKNSSDHSQINNYSFQKSSHVREIKEKILNEKNNPIVLLGAEYSRNNAYQHTNSLAYNNSSNFRKNTNENNSNGNINQIGNHHSNSISLLSNQKKSVGLLANHKKNISFKF